MGESPAGFFCQHKNVSRQSTLSSSDFRRFPSFQYDQLISRFHGTVHHEKPPGPYPFATSLQRRLHISHLRFQREFHAPHRKIPRRSNVRQIRCGFPGDSLRERAFYARIGARRKATKTGRLAQRERRSLTRTRSGVQIPHRPPRDTKRPVG